jgi:hypothetical protein
MMTHEGVDDAEVIVRERGGGTWQVESPARQRVCRMIVGDQCQEVTLARRLFQARKSGFCPLTGPALVSSENRLKRTR